MQLLPVIYPLTPKYTSAVYLASQNAPLDRIQAEKLKQYLGSLGTFI